MGFNTAADRRLSLARAVLIVGVLVITVASQAPATPASAALRSGRFRMLVTPTELTICVGEQETIQVMIPVELPPDDVGDDESPYLHLPDQPFYTEAEPRGIVSMPQRGSTGAVPGSAASFVITGAKPGETDITFQHHADEYLSFLPFTWHAAPRASAVTVHVTVERCYEAYASALESTFTEKDMGGLDDYFVLAGFLANTQGLTAATMVMFFAPSTQDDGVYAKIEQVSFQGLPCTNFSSGGYEVVFHTPTKSEGDLILQGTVSVVCLGRLLGSNNEAVQVAFRVKAAGEGTP